jgi:hypothetical protein
MRLKMGDWIEALERLQALRSEGTLSEEEFASEKARIISLRDSQTQFAADRHAEEGRYALDYNEAHSNLGCWVAYAISLVLGAIVMLAFAFFNWDYFAEARIWSDLIFEGRVAVVAVFFFIIGFMLGLGPTIILMRAARASERP